MKIDNFHLLDEPFASRLEVDGDTWNLHEDFDFDGFIYNVFARSVRLTWRPSQYGGLPFFIRAIDILFCGVSYFEVTPRDSEIPDFNEDKCLSSLSRVLPGRKTHDLTSHGIPLAIPEEIVFHMWFEFRGGQCIRIGADSATFTVQKE